MSIDYCSWAVGARLGLGRWVHGPHSLLREDTGRTPCPERARATLHAHGGHGPHSLLREGTGRTPQVVTWLECLEIVNSVAAINTFCTVLKVIATYVLMFPAGIGLNGYAYGYALSTAAGGLVLWLVVFKWKQEHLKPTRYWFGFNYKAMVHRPTNARYVKVAGLATTDLLTL